MTGMQVTAAKLAADQGDQLRAQERFTEAITAYDRAISLAPGHADLRVKRAQTKVQAGRVSEARAELALLVEREPTNAAYRQALQALHPQPSLRPAATARPGEPGVVLVVDDDEDITLAVADKLQADGWQVRRAHTLKEAVRLGTQRPLPSAVVYDYLMGEYTGLEVRDELSFRLAQQGQAEPPYVVLTARDNPVTEQWVGKRGARAYILKANWLDPQRGISAAVRRAVSE